MISFPDVSYIIYLLVRLKLRGNDSLLIGCIYCNPFDLIIGSGYWTKNQFNNVIIIEPINGHMIFTQSATEYAIL